MTAPKRFVVVGGGIVGLTTARCLLEHDSSAEIVVLDKEPTVARHQTAHNSGVVHAGVYYPAGSLKARLCRRGMGLLKQFCSEHDLPYISCGKLIVATDERELPRLAELERRATANGVPGVRRLDEAALTEIEPHARGVAALHSPETAITDFAAIAATLAGELRAAGAIVRTAADVVRVDTEARVVLSDGSGLRADRVIVCAGLQADRLAQASGQPADPRIVPFRGEYWQLRDQRRDLVRGLIYPVPDPALPFLGVHLTRKIDGAVWIGPNAVPALAREGYGRGDFRARDIVETLAWPGTWRMLRRHRRAAAGELWLSLSKRRFVDAARRYVPALVPDDVIRAPAGIRAQALDRNGTLVDDFRIDAAGGVIWVRNAPSPAATSSFAIAEHLVELAVR